jgi:hypothetical protein
MEGQVMHPKESKTSARRVQAQARAYRALELRIAGMSYVEISKAMEVSKSLAHEMVSRELDKLAKQTQEKAEKYRQIMLMKLEKIQSAFWAKALSGHEGAADRALKAIEAQRKLMGLDLRDQDQQTEGVFTLNIVNKGSTNAEGDSGSGGDADAGEQVDGAQDPVP